MHPELTKIIADYLAGELNAADQKVFEERLKNDSKLQEEVAFQKTIVEAAKRSSIRTQVAQSAKGFHLQQTVKWSTLTVAGIVLLSALSYFIYKNSSSKNADISQFKDLIEQVDKNTLISNLAPEYFAWNGKDTAMLSKNGILISIPESAFLLNGKPYTEPALIQFQEALDAATIVKAGLSTTSNGKLLETQGMFSFKALSKDGELLTINPKTGIYVQVPVDEYKDGMQIFSGVPDKNGIINWVNPKPLAKIPVPIDMEKLNFYPPGYEDSLNTMKLNKSKKYRDSLYLSCEVEISSSNVSAQLEEKSGKYLFEKKCSMCHALNRESTGPNLANIRQIWSDGGAKPNSIYQWVRNWEKAASEDPYAQTVSYKTPSASSNFPSLSNTEIDAIFDYVDGSVKFENTASFSILSTNLIYPKGDNSIKNKVNWTYSIEFIKNNEAIITAKGILNDESWGFVEIPKPFSKNKLTYQSSKAVDLNFEFSDEFTPIGNVSYDIKQFKKVCAEFSWSPNFILCRQKIKINGNSSSSIRFTNNFQISTEGFPFLLTQEVVLTKSSREDSQHIPPSNVLAFWKSKFNNTILATHDFEKRMQAIHGTCDKKVLEVYTKNLDKSMVELDRQVVQLGYSNFEEFAAENIGALNPNNPHINGLLAFYEKGIAALQNEVNNYGKTEAKRREKWDMNVNEERMKESNRTIQRNNNNYSEEYDLNYEIARKQLGRVKRQLGNTVGVTLTSTGIYNLDRFVAEVTSSRKTGEFYDKETRKTARIQYNDFSFEVEKPEQYELIYAYLFPSKLNSYQRISGNKGKFSYALNDAIVYDLAIVAISEKGYSYFQKSNLNKGNLGTIKLERVSEAKVNASIEQLNSNRISKPMRVADELSWLKTEQQNYVERRNCQNAYLFHERIKKIVFPCYEGDGNIDITEPEFAADSMIKI